MEQRFSVVIAVLVLISLGIWSYNNRVGGSPMKTEIEKMLPEHPAALPAPTDVPPAPPSPLPEQSQPQPRPKAPVGITRTPTVPKADRPPAKENMSVPQAPPETASHVTPEIRPAVKPDAAPEKPATQPAEARLGIIEQGYYSLVYEASADTWYECQTPTWDSKGVSCVGMKNFTALLPSLEVGQDDDGKSVDIQQFDGGQMVHYVYLTDGPSGAGFYVATLDRSSGKYTSTGKKYIPAPHKKVGVDMKNALSVQVSKAGLVFGP